MAAGMERVLRDHFYNKLLASRPIMPLGKILAIFLDQRMIRLTIDGSIFDNLHFILDGLERDPDEVIKRLLRDKPSTWKLSPTSVVALSARISSL